MHTVMEIEVKDECTHGKPPVLKNMCIITKGAIAPLYIGIVRVGQHCSHTFGKSAFLSLNPESIFTKGYCRSNEGSCSWLLIYTKDRMMMIDPANSIREVP